VALRRASSRALVALAAGAAVACGALVLAGGWAPGAAVEASAGAGFSHGRSALWREAIDHAADRPLTGAGADAFHAALPSLPQYAHNLPLELAVELGVPGLALALALFAATALALWRARRGAALWLLGPGVAAFLATNLVDWSWHVTSIAALWALALGALCAVPNQEDLP
jgi:O-antigen ligase